MVILIPAIHTYPQLFTKKKVAKKKARQHQGGYYFFFFNFNILKSTPNIKTTTTASVTFLNELTRELTKSLYMAGALYAFFLEILLVIFFGFVELACGNYLGNDFFIEFSRLFEFFF